MKVLGIETSGNVGGVAICEDTHVIVANDFGAGVQHGKELIPAIRTTLHEIGWKPEDIDLIAVDVTRLIYGAARRRDLRKDNGLRFK